MIFAALALIGVLSLPPFAAAGAEEDGMVTITVPALKLSVMGKLISVKEGLILIETSIGRLEVPQAGALCEGAACPSDQRTILVNARLGEEIRLEGQGGALTVEGVLRGFEDQTYRIETKIGMIEVPAGTISCAGPACPSAAQVPVEHLPLELQ